MADLPNQLAEKTLARIREALSGREVAGVPEVIQLIQELSAKAFSITVKELADLISRDVAVTAKVISAANTVGYNPYAVPISTVSRAIQVIGFERVRNLAVALLLAENAERTQSEEQREAAALALQSGFLAQEVAKQKGLELNPEQAFICASLRNYGKLLMTTFLLPEYRRARSFEADLGIDEAYRSVLGLTPLELGYHLLLSRNMPEPIMRSLQAFPGKTIEQAARDSRDDHTYLAVADFSVRLGELAIDPALDAERFELAAGQLAASYKGWIPGPPIDLDELLKSADDEMRTLRRSYGIRSLSGRVLASLKHRAAKRDIPPLPAPLPVVDAGPLNAVGDMESGEGVAAMALPETARDSAGVAPSPTGSETIVLDAIEEMTRRMADGSIAYPEAVRMLVETVHRQMKSSDTVLFLLNRTQGVFFPRFGLGPVFGEIQKTERISPKVRDVFGISLSRLEDVFVANAKDTKIARFLPSWLRRSAKDLRCFVVLPMQENGAAYGFIWSGSPRPAAANLRRETLRHLRALRTHVTTIKNLKKDGGDKTV
ncbi:MAG: HDOD domain-containing protein [Opitutales bacterium]